MDSIGERAVKAIKRHVKKGELGIELKNLDIPTCTFNSWMNGRNNPSAYYLKRMTLAGYDVIWILTGKENKNA